MTVRFILVALLLAATTSWAAPVEDLDPRLIRRQIENLRAVYTDQHPDVQFLLRKLHLAEKLKAQREATEEKKTQQDRTKPHEDPLRGEWNGEGRGDQ